MSSVQWTYFIRIFINGSCLWPPMVEDTLDLFKIEAISKVIQKKYNTPIYIISASKRFPWKIVLSTIPRREFFKKKNIFKLLFRGQSKRFMNTINQVFEPDLILFYSKKYPLGNKTPLLTIDDKNVLCVNYIAAKKLVPLLTKEPFLEYVIREYPGADLTKIGLKSDDVNILKSESKFPKKGQTQKVWDYLFPPPKEDLLKIDLKESTEKEREDFYKNFNKIINSEGEISKKEKVIKKVKGLIKRNALEEEFQEIITKNPWLMGDEYFQCKPGRHKFGKNSIPDLIIKDLFNNQNLVIELKRAIKIAKKDTRLKGKIAPTSDIMNALWQGIRYLEDQIKKGKYSTVYIIIGFGKDGVQTMINKINFHINNIRFITYNELVDRAEERLKSYKPKGLNWLINFLKKYRGKG